MSRRELANPGDWTIIGPLNTGLFARQWEMEQMLSYPTFSKLKARALRHPLNEAEDKLWSLLGREESL